MLPKEITPNTQGVDDVLNGNAKIQNKSLTIENHTASIHISINDVNKHEAFKRLKTKFDGKSEVKGYLFILLGMTNQAFLYEVSSDDSKHYEVFKKVVNKRFDCISYPTSKSFGIWAFTYMNLKSAIKKYNELNQKISDK